MSATCESLSPDEGPGGLDMLRLCCPVLSPHLVRERSAGVMLVWVFPCWTSLGWTYTRPGQPWVWAGRVGRTVVMTSWLPGQASPVSQLQQHRQHGGLRHVAQGQGHLRPAQVPSGVQCVRISARGERTPEIIRHNLSEIRSTWDSVCVQNCTN